MIKHDPEHRDFIMRLLKQGGASAADKAHIFQLYKLYIDPTHITWTDTACASCSSSIQKMWSEVKEYILSEKFTIESNDTAKNTKK